VAEYEGRCGSCGAFTRTRHDPERGFIGECALEVFPPPIRATATCSRYRPKGAAAPPPAARVAGEPRRRAAVRASSSSARAHPDAPIRRSVELPTEVDIDMDIEEFRRVLREVLSDELGVSDATIAPRWDGGEVVLKPGNQTQEKRIPLDVLFKKIIGIRDKLRVLEQRINAHDKLSGAEKMQLQQYVTGCYGSLTTFNLLFADRDEGFTGAGKDDE
jgi:hypothetical protein